MPFVVDKKELELLTYFLADYCFGNIIFSSYS